MEVIFVHSDSASLELQMLARHPIIESGFLKWQHDIQKAVFRMARNEVSPESYATHLLNEKYSTFPYIGFLSTHLHKDEPLCRIVWKICYSNVPDHPITDLDSLDIAVQTKIWKKISKLSKQFDKFVVVFLQRACVDYHKDRVNAPIAQIDCYLTAFEDEYLPKKKKLKDSFDYQETVEEDSECYVI